MMPCIVQLGSQPYLFSWNARVFDPLPHLFLVAIFQGSVDVAISFVQRDFDSVADFAGCALPGPETNGWDLVAGAEGEGLPEGREG